MLTKSHVIGLIPPVDLDHTILALKTNLCHVFCFLEFENTWVLLQKPPCSGLVVNVLNGLFALPTIHRLVALWSVDLLKGQSPKISDSTCLTSWSSIFLTRRFVHWMWLPPERNHLLSDTFWVIIRNYVHLFENWRFHPDISALDTSLFSLMATLGQPDWCNFLVAARLIGT